MRGRNASVAFDLATITKYLDKRVPVRGRNDFLLSLSISFSHLDKRVPVRGRKLLSRFLHLEEIPHLDKRVPVRGRKHYIKFP